MFLYYLLITCPVALTIWTGETAVFILKSMGTFLRNSSVNSAIDVTLDIDCIMRTDLIIEGQK